MVDFDKFEKNVKDNYGNQEFPFDEQNWEKAAQLIDASRKGKNRGGIILWSVAALLVTSSLVYYFGFSDSTKSLQNNEVAINQNNNNVNEVGNINSAANVSDNSISTTSEEKTDHGVSNANVAEKETLTKLNSNTSSTTAKNNSKNQSSLNNSNSSENSSKAQFAADKANDVSSNESIAKITNTSSSVNSESAKTSNTSNTNTKKTTPIKSTAKSATPPVLGGNSLVQNTPKSVVSNSNASEIVNTNKLGDLTNNSNSDKQVKNNIAVLDSNSAVFTASVKPTESSLVDSVPAVKKSRADSLAAILPNGTGVSYATNVKEKHNAKNILYMEVGTTYLLGWNGGGKNEANGFNLLGGINFQHYFTGSIAAQIGVQYNTIANLTNTTHTISTSNYDFGLEKDVTSIRYQKLHYVVAPIKVTFNAGEKNIIGIGVNVGYLLNSESKKEKYKTNSSDPNAAKSNYTSSKEIGYVQGFNPLDMQVGVSYRRRIYKGLSANAEFFYGLTDTKNNGFFKSDNFDRNTGFKVSLCYDLFKK